MSESLKEIIIDKVVDQLLGIVVDITKDEIIELFNKNNNQKILWRTIQLFSRDPFFTSEFPNLKYQENKDTEKLIYTITPELINVTNSIEQIASSINEIIQTCFPAGDEEAIKKISMYVATQYTQRAKMTVQLYDIVRVQQDNFSQISSEVSEIADIIASHYNHETRLQEEKESLLKQELKNEVDSLLCEIMRNYLYLVMKESPELIDSDVLGLPTAMINKINEVCESLHVYINEDFLRLPVHKTCINGAETSVQEISCLQFSEIHFRNVVLHHTEHLLKYKDLFDLETYVYILRLRNIMHGNAFIPLIKMGQTNIIKATNLTIDVDFFRHELYSVGKLIILLFEKF